MIAPLALAIEAPAPALPARRRPGSLRPPLESRAWLLWGKAAVVADMPGHLLLTRSRHRGAPLFQRDVASNVVDRA
jgi:hypothetical protein